MKGKIKELNKMKELNKKTTSILIISILMLSMLIVLPVKAGVVIDTGYPASEARFVVGDVIEVTGTGVTAGVTVKLYWDYVTTSGYMNETTGKPDGSYEVSMTIPESVLGAHYIWVKEMDTGTTSSIRVAIDPEIELSPTSGLAGDPLTVEGHGYLGSKGIDIFFGTQARVRLIQRGSSTAAWDTDPATSPTHGYVVKLVGADGSDAKVAVYIPSGITLDAFDPALISFDYYGTAETNIPSLGLRFVAPDCIDPDDDTSLHRGHADITITGLGTVAETGVWDTSPGITGSSSAICFGNKPLTAESWGPRFSDIIDPDFESDFDTIKAAILALDTNYGDWELTNILPLAGWAVVGTYYVDDVTYDSVIYDLEQPIKTATSGSTGYFTATFPVPSGDGPKLVSAIGGNDNFAEGDFTIGACITLTPESGPSGTIVTIEGRGWTEEKTISAEIESIPMVEVEDEVLIVGSGGTFSVDFVIPTMDDETEYTIEVSESDPVEGPATAIFEVTGNSAIVLTPVSGEPSSDVTIEGVNFTAIVDTKVTIDFGEDVTNYKTFYTNATGGFKETFTIPSLVQGPYTVTATDENGLTATDDFQIAITFVSINPKKGPSGTQATILGLGFTGDTANVTLGTELIFEEISVSELEAGKLFTMPTVPVDTYTITIEDSDGLTATTSFEVTKTTELILTPESAPVTYTVSIEANYFTAVDGTDITFTLYNETAGERDYEEELVIEGTLPWTLIETNETGSFKGTFDVQELDLGDYIINATDANGLTVEAPFSVVKAYREIHTRLDEYNSGDTVRFYVNATFEFNLKINIEDPTGYPFTTINCPTSVWVKVGDYYIVPYADASFALPSDADVGTWNWTAIDHSASPEVEVDSGNFTVGVITPDVGTLSISTAPVDGEVFVDEESWGTAPAPREVEVGTHTVSYGDVDGYTTPDSEEVTLVADETEVILGTYVLIPIVPQLVITYTPETVYVNDEVTITVEADEAPVSGVSVYIHDPSEQALLFRNTDDLGTCTFTAYEDGDWLIDAGKDGYTDADITIEVLEAVQPELPAETTGEEPLDSNGAPKTSFALGETVLASAEVTNIGTQSQPMLIAVQWTDSEYRTLAPVFLITTLSPGQSFVYAPGLTLPLTGYATGTWTATILVFDTWPALGGVTIGEPVTITITVI